MVLRRSRFYFLFCLIPGIPLNNGRALARACLFTRFGIPPSGFAFVGWLSGGGIRTERSGPGRQRAARTDRARRRAVAAVQRRSQAAAQEPGPPGCLGWRGIASGGERSGARSGILGAPGAARGTGAAIGDHPGFFQHGPGGQGARGKGGAARFSWPFGDRHSDHPGFGGAGINGAGGCVGAVAVGVAGAGSAAAAANGDETAGLERPRRVTGAVRPGAGAGGWGTGFRTSRAEFGAGGVATGDPAGGPCPGGGTVQGPVVAQGSVAGWVFPADRPAGLAKPDDRGWRRAAGGAATA